MRRSICWIPHVTRRRKRIYTLCTALVAVLFVFHQLKILYLVSHQESSLPSPIKGVHRKDYHFYVPLDGKFKCFLSGEVIDFNKVNDDYCDCGDSTDEPGTNACPDGSFYCGRTLVNVYPVKVPSSMVNDGICDCCDGSDEFSGAKLIGQNIQTQCLNVC